MSDVRKGVKRIVPSSLWNTLREGRDAVVRAREWPAATFHPWRRASKARLALLKDSQRGKRCFILGNGPSLRETDLSRLRGEQTFGMNRIYLLFPEMGFSTTYLISVNSLVIEQCAAEIQALSIPRFLSWRSRSHITPDEDTVFLHTTYTGPMFAKEAGGRLWEGGTVTFVALQLAFHMGYEEVILIGVDHSFVSQGDPNQTVVSGGDDPDHFHPGYFGKGFRWQLPDLVSSERGYKMARQAFEADNRKVIDATIGGKLTVFPKADYDSLF